MSSKKGETKNLWILKPVGLNRGQGIHVVDTIKKCKKLMREYYTGREVVNKQPQKKSEQKQQSIEEMQLNSTYGVKQLV